MKTVISSKGQIVLPAELRKQDRIRPGQKFKIKRVKAGQYLISKEERKNSKEKDKVEPANQGLVDLLLACPVKGWFKPRKRLKSESIAAKSRRIRELFSE